MKKKLPVLERGFLSDLMENKIKVDYKKPLLRSVEFRDEK